MSAPITAADLRKEQQAEWGAYVAVVPIDIAGARAFNVGDPVPATHVKDGVVAEDQVKTTASKAGQAAIANPAPSTGPTPVTGFVSTEKG